MAVGTFKLPISSASTEWVRPSDWLPMPTGITSANQTFVGLHAVFPSGQNYAALAFATSTGQYRVDWGDGTITLHNSNTIAQYEYNYATISNSTLTSRGYKQAMITATPVSGNFLSFNIQQRYVSSPTQNVSYSTGFLDCILSIPNANTGATVQVGGTNLGHRYLERFDIKTIGNCNNLSNFFTNCLSLQSVPLFDTTNVISMAGMFSNCRSLKSIPLFNTINVTSFNSMFQNCSALQSVPLLNTSNGLNLSFMFSTCGSLLTVPLFNTSSATNMQAMFTNCTSIESIPLLNTSLVTNMQTMFTACQALETVPLFNTPAVTNMQDMFNSCQSLQSIPLLNTANVTNMSVMFAGCASLKEIPALSTASITAAAGTDFNNWQGCSSLGSCKVSFARNIQLNSGQLSKDALVEIFNNLANRILTTSANINITGNWGASALTVADRLIATAKNWTITG